MIKSFTLGIVGAGKFAPTFIQLFSRHPLVTKVWVTDLVPERAKAMHEKYGVDTMDSFEEMLENPAVNAVALFVPRHQHGPLVVKALMAGKHVFSAVPMGCTVEECQEIIDLVRETRLTYMMAETCYYFPCAVWCRQANRANRFGKPIYIAAQYYHDLDGFHYERLGEGWERVAGFPPMLYPTHSFAMALSALDAHVTHISCVGYKDTEDDNVFGEGCNLWDNPYSCEVSLAQLSNGAIARISEFRRVGVFKPSSYISTLIGTKGAYECSLDRHLYQHKVQRGIEDVVIEDVSSQVNPANVTEGAKDPDHLYKVAHNRYGNKSYAPCLDTKRLPQSFKDATNGHMGTHQLLADDFCRSVISGKLPPLNAWFAARINIPGLIAHESAMKGGIQMQVPDPGDPPSDWELLDYPPIYDGLEL